jgi:CHAT domain-containing protein/tetratricopeptide (TPR) repeat protein
MADNNPSTTVAQHVEGLIARVKELHQEGRYQDAITIAAHARDLTGHHLGLNHPQYATALNLLARGLRDLAFSYEESGDAAAALSLFREVLEIHRTTLGENSLEYTFSLVNLAITYEHLGDHAAAVALYRQALESRPEDFLCLRLAGLYQSMGDHAAALPLYRQALEIQRTADDKYSGSAYPLADMADSLVAMGDHAAALPLYRQALEILGTAREDSGDYIEILNHLAALYAAADRASDAIPLMEQAAAIDDRQMIGQGFKFHSEEWRASILNASHASYFPLLSLVLQHLGDSPDAIHAAYELVLRRKAIGAEAIAAQRDAVRRGKYPSLEPQLRDLAALRMKIARKTLAGPGPEDLESHKRVLGEWKDQRERLEEVLARQIPEMNLEQKLRASDRRAVAMNLPDGVALVEFVRSPVSDFQSLLARPKLNRKGKRYGAIGMLDWKPDCYVAFMLSGDAPDDVQMIVLGEAEPIDRLIADFRAGIIANVETKDDRNMAKLREETPSTPVSDAGAGLRLALFDRLAPALGSRTRLLIAPDGDLTRLPFEALPTGNGRCMIDDYQISYLSCGRDVLRFGTGVTGQPGEPLIVADPDFDLEEMITTGPVPANPWFWSRLIGRCKKAIKTPLKSVPTPATTAGTVGRHSRDLDRNRSAYHFHRLPGTRAEGEWVATRLDVSPWLDATALEGRLKSACRSPRILHLATHGFFLPDQKRDLNREGHSIGFNLGEFSGAQDGPGRLSVPLMEDPMLRSGLALAGANTWLKAGNLPEEAEDGLMTAEDVAGLDLVDTELVVLSACETGLGQVHRGEGVFGLRRAFVLAGAKTLVMSLWKVPDEPTRELMEHFYGRLLAGQGRAEALREAQLAMKAKYPDPFYWGAFICQGDPSPLGTVSRGLRGVRPCKRFWRVGFGVWTRALRHLYPKLCR